MGENSFSTWLPIVPILLNFYHTLDFHRGASTEFLPLCGIRGLPGFPGNLMVSHFTYRSKALAVNPFQACYYPHSEIPTETLLRLLLPLGGRV